MNVLFNIRTNIQKFIQRKYVQIRYWSHYFISVYQDKKSSNSARSDWSRSEFLHYFCKYQIFTWLFTFSILFTSKILIMIFSKMYNLFLSNLGDLTDLLVVKSQNGLLLFTWKVNLQRITFVHRNKNCTWRIFRNFLCVMCVNFPGNMK